MFLDVGRAESHKHTHTHTGKGKWSSAPASRKTPFRGSLWPQIGLPPAPPKKDACLPRPLESAPEANSAPRSHGGGRGFNMYLSPSERFQSGVAPTLLPAILSTEQRLQAVLDAPGRAYGRRPPPLLPGSKRKPKGQPSSAFSSAGRDRPLRPPANGGAGPPPVGIDQRRLPPRSTGGEDR